MNKIIKTSFVFMILFLQVFINIVNGSEKEKSHVIQVGGGSVLSNQFNKTFSDQEEAERAYKLMRNGEVDLAIKEFNAILSKKDSTAKIEAKSGLIDAYEKKKEYVKAAEILKQRIAKYVLPVGDLFRTPDDERLEYLRWAAQGEYELAVEHAEKALEADRKLPNTPKEGNPDYIERLNDLIAAKDYILSLKKNQAGK